MKVIKILFLIQLAFIFNATASKVIDFNFGWKFALDESKKEFYSINFDDTKWNDIRLTTRLEYRFGLHAGEYCRQ